MSNNKKSEIDYSKLTKDELVELMQQEDKIIKKRDEKIDDLYQKLFFEKEEEQKPFDKAEEKLKKLFEEKGDVINYPLKEVSLDEYRKEEALKAKNFKKGSSFLNLFDQRIKEQIKKNRADVKVISITIYVAVDDGMTTLRRSFGAFQEEIPKLTKDDMYKFMVYVLLKNNFSLQSAQFITAIGAKVITFNKSFFMDHKMGRLKLELYLLCDQNPIISYGEYTCVLDFVWNQVRGRRGFKTYNYHKLKQELYEFLRDD